MFKILEQCSGRIQLRGAARRLYTADGTLVLKLDDLVEWVRDHMVKRAQKELRAQKGLDKDEHIDEEEEQQNESEELGTTAHGVNETLFNHVLPIEPNRSKKFKIIFFWCP